MRSLLLLACLWPGLALAQPAPSAREAYAPPAEPALDQPEDGPPPEAGREELFTLTPYWRLEPQTRRLELRYGAAGAPGSVDQSLQVRAALGLSTHLQLAVAEDLARPSGGEVAHQGSRVALRYAVAGGYGEVPGNPVLEGELRARHHAPDRAALRASFSGAPVRGLVVASSAYLEQNLERHTAEGVDGAFGATLGFAWLYKPGVRMGAELQLGLAQRGLAEYRPALLVGPTMSVQAERFTITSSAQADLSEETVRPVALLSVARPF